MLIARQAYAPHTHNLGAPMQAALACKEKILQRLSINQRKRRARLKFRLLLGNTQPTPQNGTKTGDATVSGGCLAAHTA